jgi:predicted nucleic acid-binding protein
VAGLTLDSGALIAYERNETYVRAWLEKALERAEPPTVPTVVIAETWRGGARSARIARLLKFSRIEPLDQDLAREAGSLLASVSAGAVDAVVVASAARRADIILTSDPGDLSALATHVAGVQVEQI